MTKVLHARPYGRFINPDSNFLRGTFSIRDNERLPIKFTKKDNPSILTDNFFSRTDPSNFTSTLKVKAITLVIGVLGIAPMRLRKWLSETVTVTHITEFR